MIINKTEVKQRLNSLNQYVIEKINPKHDADICNIIKHVGAEFGAIGDGFGPGDAEVRCMSQHYGTSSGNANSEYWVATIDERVIGGGGIAAFNGSEDICELRKLFIIPSSRGLGIGKALTLTCLNFAREQHFKQCYLDTLSNMKQARSLYEKLGFNYLERPLGNGIHSGCDVWMIKAL